MPAGPVPDASRWNATSSGWKNWNRSPAGFDGVRQAFAISAGRELRVIVNSTKTTDEQAATICHDIAKAFENELTYPGEIKVTVVRESRFTETAK